MESWQALGGLGVGRSATVIIVAAGRLRELETVEERIAALEQTLFPNRSG